jgi:hypothetical protein
MVYIIDIDDTLTMPSQIAKPSNDAEWHELYKKARPNVMLIERLKAQIEPDDTVIVCTGRKKKNKSVTEEWLLGIGIQYHILMMRDNNDDRTAVDVKRDFYIKIANAIPKKLLLLIDDDNEVRDMARILKISAIHPSKFTTKEII